MYYHKNVARAAEPARFFVYGQPAETVADTMKLVTNSTTCMYFIY